MERATRRDAARVVLALVAAVFALPASAQQAADGGTQQRIVIVPAQPEAPQPQQRIVIVPAQPEAPQQPQQRIVIVPAQPEAPAQPQQRIVIVPNPDAAAAASDAGTPAQRIVIVPNPQAAPSGDATAGANGTPGAGPDTGSGTASTATGTAPTGSAATDTGTSNPVGTGSAAAPEQSGEGASPDGAEGTASTATDGSNPADDGSGNSDGLHSVTANPDLPPATETPPAVEVGGTATATASPATPTTTTDVPVDPHARVGPFLSGPGSLTFILHHTLMGAAGGFATQGIASGFSSDTGGKEAILAGTLVGAGIGFGTSSWWQFNHWTGQTAANFGIVNSVSGGMFLTGLLDLTTDDSTALAWSSFLGAEVGGWLTAGMSGGDLPLDSALLIASGEGWGAIYGALMLAIVRFSGSSLRTESAIDTLFIAQGAGAILSAFALSHFHPSAGQLLRADVSGAVVGGAVLLISALVLGHLDSPTPYALSMASSVTTMALVSIFWDESAEPGRTASGAAQYRSEWW